MWSARRATDESDSTQSAMAPTLISVELATRSQGILAALLALIAGYIDSYSLLTYEVYTSFMSGNTTQAGLNAGQGQLASRTSLAAHSTVRRWRLHRNVSNPRRPNRLIAPALLHGRGPPRRRQRCNILRTGRLVVRRHSAQPCNGHNEHHGHPRRWPIRQPGLRDWRLEQSRQAPCICRSANADVGCAGTMGYSLVAGYFARACLVFVLSGAPTSRCLDALRRAWTLLPPVIALVLLTLFARDNVRICPR